MNPDPTNSGGSAPPSISNPDPFWASSPENLADEESILRKKLVIFGTDVTQVPCFRNSFLYGILSGFGMGIGHFAVTSRVAAATTFGFYSYVGITFTYWCMCRWNYSKTKFEYQRISYALARNAELSGTEKAIPGRSASIEVKDMPFETKDA